MMFGVVITIESIAIVIFGLITCSLAFGGEGFSYGFNASLAATLGAIGLFLITVAIYYVNYRYFNNKRGTIQCH
jgi:hypothetical protein